MVQKEQSEWGRQTGQRLTARNGQRLFLPDVDIKKGHSPAVIFLDQHDNALLTVESPNPESLSVIGKLERYPSVEIRAVYKSGTFISASICCTFTTDDGIQWRPGYFFDADSGVFSSQKGVQNSTRPSIYACPVTFYETEEGVHTMFEASTMRPVLSVYGAFPMVQMEDGIAGFPVNIDFYTPEESVYDASQALWKEPIQFLKLEAFAYAGEDLRNSIYGAR